MKQLLFFLLMFCAVANGQFTIRSLSALTSSNFAQSDLMLVSLASPLGTLRKITYSNFRQNLEGETWEWLTSHTFNGTVSLGTVAGTVTATGGWTFENTVELDGTNTFGGATTITGTLSLTNFTQFLGSAQFVSGDSVVVSNGKFAVQSGATARFDGVSTFNGASTFTDDVTLADVLSANVTGTISYAPGNDITAPTATWDVGGLPQVVILSVQDPITVTSMTNAVDGQVLMIVNGAEQGDWVTIQNNSTINLRGSRDFVFSDQWQSLTLVYTDQNTNEWSEIARSHEVTADFNNIDANGTLNVAGVSTLTGAINVAGISTFSEKIILNDELIYEPEEISLIGGSQTIAVTQSFVVLDGNGGLPSTVSDFTGLKNEGQRLIVMCLRADVDGFDILDNVNIECHGGADLTLTGGDIAEFIYMDGKWASTSPLANNN